MNSCRYNKNIICECIMYTDPDTLSLEEEETDKEFTNKIINKLLNNNIH